MGRPHYRPLGAVSRELREPLLGCDPSALRADAGGQDDWCFTRLGPDDEAGWLHHRRDEWLASGLQWPNYLRDWAERERLHRGDELVRLLDERLQRESLENGPYFFPDLADTTAGDEQTAIDAGQIRATRIDWVGALP